MERPTEDFAGYVARASASLARTAFLLTGDRGLAQDLLQDSLAAVAQRWSAVSGLRTASARLTVIYAPLSANCIVWASDALSGHRHGSLFGLSDFWLAWWWREVLTGTLHGLTLVIALVWSILRRRRPSARSAPNRLADPAGWRLACLHAGPSHRRSRGRTSSLLAGRRGLTSLPPLGDRKRSPNCRAMACQR